LHWERSIELPNIAKTNSPQNVSFIAGFTALSTVNAMICQLNFAAEASHMGNWFTRRRNRIALTYFWLVLTIVICLGQVKSTTAQVKLTDIQGHWAQACIENLVQQRIINGYADGTFRPNATVSRAEFAAMVVPAFPAAVNATLPRSMPRFADVPANHWAANAIGRAYVAEFVSGYPGNVFRPQQTISRAQALVALANGLNLPQPASESGTLAGFQDAASIPNYARGAIATATANRLVVNYPNVKLLKPNQPASRADIAAFICQARSRGTQNSLIPSTYIAGGTTETPQATGSRQEIRGVWLTNIDSDVLYSRDRLKDAIQELARLKFNTLYPAIWTWGYTLYNSPTAAKAFGTAIEPESPLPPTYRLDGRDILAETIELGHQQGMAVIPWFEFGFMTTADSELARRHPDWLTTKQDGSRIWREGKYDRVWLNPFHPDAQQFILDLLTEIVSNYNVDGIQLDDHFGLPFEFGYDAFTTKLYQQEHQNRLPPTDPKDAEWTRWRADKITDFLTRAFKTIKARKENVLIALSPNSQKFSYEHSLADWQTWERQGLVEEIVLQVYRNSLDSFKSELDQPEVVAAKNHIPVGIGILSGLKDRSVPMSQIQEQVQAARDRKFAGVSFFFYETLWNLSGEPANDRKTVLQKLFATPVQRPSVLKTPN
jgi:uncharacterized lipoprotein YddW (UPF0748 family)